MSEGDNSAETQVIYILTSEAGGGIVILHLQQADFFLSAWSLLSDCLQDGYVSGFSGRICRRFHLM